MNTIEVCPQKTQYEKRREYLKQYAKNRYQNDEEYKKKQLDRVKSNCKDKYNENHEYREYKNNYNKQYQKELIKAKNRLKEIETILQIVK